jgi:hypothetical protein
MARGSGYETRHLEGSYLGGVVVRCRGESIVSST